MERSTDEILAKIKDLEQGSVDFFGFIRPDLIECLPFDAAKPFLKPECTSDDWEPKARDADSVKERMRDYMSFAWDKANNRRGISACRSLQHMQAWLWLLGEDEASGKFLDDYSHYGKPQLRAICEAFGWDWREWDDGRWTSDEMAEGLSPPEIIPALPLCTESAGV